MDRITVNLDSLYAGLSGIIRPPETGQAFRPHADPLLLDAVKEVCYQAARLLGWRFEGNIPPGLQKAVIIIAPHTSMLDLLVGMAAYRHFREITGYYLAKRELFRGPLGYFFRHTGGIPVDRSHPGNLIEEVAALFEGSGPFFLGLAPEGTRSRTERWKSGFYRIALEAQVPILLGFLDFKRKTAGIGEVLYPSGDYAADARIIEDFYRTVTPRWPEKWNWKVL